MNFHFSTMVGMTANFRLTAPCDGYAAKLVRYA